MSRDEERGMAGAGVTLSRAPSAEGPGVVATAAPVPLAPGETGHVRLAVPVGELAWYDETAGWTVEAIDYEAIVGHHAHDDAALARRFRVTDGSAP